MIGRDLLLLFTNGAAHSPVLAVLPLLSSVEEKKECLML